MPTDPAPDHPAPAPSTVPSNTVSNTNVSNTNVSNINVLGVGITPVNLPDAVACLRQWHEAGRREYVCCVSVHGLVSAQRDPAVRDALNGAGLATKDGMPLVWWCRRAGAGRQHRVCGSDLMEAMCALGAAHGHRHYFYGGTAPVVARLAERLAERHPGLVVAGFRSPPFRPLDAFEQAAEIAIINAAQPDFVWVGLGMPKQEKWMARHIGQVHATALLGVGAAFDFHAGAKPRAPVWMQQAGLEWLFRLLSEPRRLAHRYLIDNSLFILHAIRQRAGLAAYGPDRLTRRARPAILAGPAPCP